jgi:hypothetical protein
MPVVARGAAIFAVSAAVQMLLRMLGRRAVQLPVSLIRGQTAKKKTNRLPAKREEETQPEAPYAVQETLLLRRTTLRR